jgi:hypothetical protein
VEKSNKLKAAIAGVLYYLQEKEKENMKKPNLWVQLGRELIMKNRFLVQRRMIRR